MRVGCCVVVPLLIAISLFLPTCHAILSGRSIKMSTRARHGTTETAWKNVMSKYSPRFRYDKVVELPNHAAQALNANDVLKLSFSFCEDEFITPWVTVWDAKEDIFLNVLEFVFVFSGDKIIGVDIRVDYASNPDQRRKSSSHLTIKFSWNEQGLEDVDAMLGFVLCGGFILSLLSIFYVLADGQASVSLRKLGKSMGEYDAPKTSTSLPYVDTSADVFSKQCENYEAKSARITRNHAYDAQNGTGTSATEVKSRDKDQRNLEGSGEVIPMEAFPEDEGVVIVDDFVSLETSPASPALLYPQQPVMRRQGYEERSKQTKAD
jgi:hypothetical protein